MPGWGARPGTAFEPETDAPCEGCPDPACKHYEVAGHEPVCARKKRSQFDDNATRAMK